MSAYKVVIMAKHPGGRPRKFSKKRVKELQDAFEEYIDSHEIPIVAEFAYTNNILRENLYDYPEFSTLIKKCIGKKEANLEHGMLSGGMPPAAAIFSLKQLGWSDKKEFEHSGNIGVQIVDDIEEADD